MANTIEVLKQMVEALEWCHGGEPVGTAEAIKAGKQAIAELESQEPVMWITPSGEGFRIRFTPPTNDVPLGWDALYNHPPQEQQSCDKRTEQEPVATVSRNQDESLTFTPLYDFYVTNGMKLYAAPQQRTWVGLTDDELCEIEKHYLVNSRIPLGGQYDFYRAAEAKLKEKNGIAPQEATNE
jgi:hypothetical protein